MKRNLYLLTLGLVLCSCSEPGDVVTGHARIVLKTDPAPVATVAEVPTPEVVTPAPEVVTPAPVDPAPAPEPVIDEPETSAVAQNQPVTTEPEPASTPQPFFSQKQSEATVITSTQPTAPVVETPAPEPKVTVHAPQPKPVVTAPAPKPQVIQAPAPKPAPAKPVVTQQQPRATVPAGTSYYAPQTVQPKKRTYPIMPGQNRGLRNRY